MTLACEKINLKNASLRGFKTYGSNSCMTLSNLNTANNLVENATRSESSSGREVALALVCLRAKCTDKTHTRLQQLRALSALGESPASQWICGISPAERGRGL